MKRSRKHEAAHGTAPIEAVVTAVSPADQDAPPVQASARWLAGVAAVLFAIATGISLFLAWQSMAGNAIPGCGPESGCSHVLGSRWSSVGGMPVSLLGAGLYAALLVAALSAGPWLRLERGMAVLVVAGALWFTAVQAFVLKSFCPWCGTVHAVACAGALTLWLARRKAMPVSGVRPGFAELALPLAAVAGMAVFQQTSPDPERIQQQTLADAVVSGAGMMSLHGGQITFDPAGLPGIGLPEATVTAVALTDFTCPHCRELHRTLEQLAAERPGEFHAVLLPAAYEPEARELHRIMLALWRIDPDHYRQLAAEMAEGSLDPDAATVIGALQQKLGGRFYELAWAHAGWVQDTLRLGEQLLAANGREAGAATLPQTLIRDRVLTGAPHLETLAGIIDAAPEPAAPALAVSAPEAKEAPAVSGAEITFESSTVDLGTVTRGESVTRKVTFTNTGSAPLTLTRIKASCGCTTVKGWEQTVPPGKQGSFELKLDTSKMTGLVSKTVDVESNAANGAMRLLLKATIWCPVTLQPSMIAFGPTLKGSKVEPRVIDITVTEPEPMPITGVTCSNPYFKMELATVEEGRRYRLTVAVPELGTRTQNGEVVLALEHPKFPQLKIPAYISPVDPLVVQPKLINLSAARLKQSPTTSITIFCHDPAVAELQVTDLAYSGGGDVAVSFERQGNNRWGRVTLTFPPGFTPDDAKEASVSFRTNHPDHPQVTVPVRFPGSPPAVRPLPVAKSPPATEVIHR